ncbi:DUF1697 domain-containing protein [Ulvibacterium marinum]|uniref:DUF1697 domain-containing protein n=1 Tax=Ulvibacterium marinum TaxID=2419782 RepID=UPI002495995B|nr:DUF1697 domain-containing protein [Ulvibacterium marinum]
MYTYIILLRGINVSGQKKMKMDVLRTLLENLGFQNVATYIQSGNIVLQAKDASIRNLEDIIGEGIREHFGFDVPILVKSKTDLERIVKENPFKDAITLEGNRLYFVLLKSVPEQVLVESLAQETFENQEFRITDSCVYLWCKNGYGKAKLDNNFLERKLKVQATTRNYRTMLKLLEMAKG